jgi:hypothetical protein
VSDRSVEARGVSNSVVVTGDGNTVALSFGDTGVRLQLLRKQFPPPGRRRQPAPGEPPRELDLLVPEAGKLPLIGRKDLFAELQAWLDDEVDISVFGLIGRAGSGKTRLALEFCRAIDCDRGAKGEWVAGFLLATDLSPVVDKLATHSFEWERRTLLVIDYAAGCHQALARWLDRLSYGRLDHKLRLLLLDREAPEAFGWWHELTGSGPPSRRDLFHALRPRQLPGLSDHEERRALVSAALQAARELRPEATSDRGIPAMDEEPDFDRRLTEPQFGNPLNLVMAGVIALDRGPQAALALRRLDAARGIARRELRRLTDLARTRQVGDDEMRHMIALNGLAGGLPIAELRKTVADELAATRRSADHLSELLTLLQQELPPRSEGAQNPRLATSQPDLIGEAVIIEALTGDPAREAEAAEMVNRAYALGGQVAAEVLVHLVQDFAHALEDTNAPEEEKATGRRILNWLLSLAAGINDPEQVVPLAFALPEQTTILREPAAELAQRLASYFLGKAEQSNDPVARISAAVSLNNLAVRLGDLGRLEAALTAVEKAIHLYRTLAAARSDSLVPGLPLSLNNLATILSDLGRREAALTVAEEAVQLHRTLAEARPDAFIPALAMSLNTLADILSDLGRREAALTAAEDAVCLYLALREDYPGEFIPDLARSLNNLAKMLSKLGRRKEALRAAEEAVRLRRALAEARPDAFIPDLGRSLDTLANNLSDLGRREDALVASGEAVQLYRNLAKTLSDAFSSELAASLANFAAMLRALGRREEALTAADEAVQLYRSLTEARPDAFGPDLASSLGNFANLLFDLGRCEEALTTAAEAVRLFRGLAEARPDAFIPSLALSLNNLGKMLSDLGQYEEALTSGEEAVRLRRVLAKAQPDAFMSDLALSLNNLAKMLSDLCQRKGALTAAEEAVHLYRTLAKALPEAFSPHLADSLNNLANRLSALGRRKKALRAAEEAVRLYRTLAEAHPDEYLVELARSLLVLAINAEKPAFSIATLTEAIRILTPIFLNVQTPMVGLMAGVLQNYLGQCQAIGREPDAELLDPALAVFERLMTKEEKA